jgi:hypothetical protein
MPRLERKETPARSGDLLLINPIMELHVRPRAPRVFGVSALHVISHVSTVLEWIPAFFGQRIPALKRISQVRQ